MRLPNPDLALAQLAPPTTGFPPGFSPPAGGRGTTTITDPNDPLGQGGGKPSPPTFGGSSGLLGVIGAGLNAFVGWVSDVINQNKAPEDGETLANPPTGSKPINQTPWSGDHGKIKGSIGLGAADNTSIDKDGNVWGQNPNGTWTNYGYAGDYTGSGKANGQKGDDRSN